MVSFFQLLGHRRDGVRLTAKDGLRQVWFTTVTVWLALLLGTLVGSANLGWTCPTLPGCRIDSFWPGDAPAQVHMLFRTVLLLSVVLVWFVTLRSWAVQPRAVRLVSTLTTAIATLYLVLVDSVVMGANWQFFALLHIVVGGGLFVSVTALLIVFLRYGQRVPIKKKLPVDAAATTGTRGLIRDFVALTKPRIISLLLLTTLAAMLLAVDHAHPISFGLVMWTLLGGYLAAGGANAINMYLDRDVDALMGRTSRRPLPSSRLRPIDALIFGLLLNVLAFVVLALSSNVLAGALAIGGSIYYVLVYTRLLKRTTTQNIVIGGAAGAVPPLVGWAAVTGHINLAALLLFAIIFYWTPPHFWALALLRRADYARAGIPMLPVAHGEAETKWQILLYSFLMVAISVLPTPLRITGLLYLVVALGLGVWFIRLAFKLFREPGTRMAWPLYKYSLLYLALLFGALVVDHLLMLSLA